MYPSLFSRREAVMFFGLKGQPRGITFLRIRVMIGSVIESVSRRLRFVLEVNGILDITFKMSGIEMGPYVLAQFA
jgi:hypothetical protein